MAVMALGKDYEHTGPLAHVKLDDVPEGIEHAGERLRLLREASKHTLESMASEIGVPVSTYRFWEEKPGRLKRRKHAGKVRKVAEVLYTSDLRIWYGDNPTAYPSDALEPEDDDVLSDDVILFLTRLSRRKDLPADVAGETKDLLKRYLELE